MHLYGFLLSIRWNSSARCPAQAETYYSFLSKQTSNDDLLQISQGRQMTCRLHVSHTSACHETRATLDKVGKLVRMVAPGLRQRGLKDAIFPDYSYDRILAIANA